MHATDKTSLNLNIGSYVLKVLANITSGTGKNMEVCFTFRLPGKQKTTLWRCGFGKDFQCCNCRSKIIKEEIRAAPMNPTSMSHIFLVLQVWRYYDSVPFFSRNLFDFEK